MRLLKAVLALSGSIAWACGGSSSSGLFDGTGNTSIGGSSAGGVVGSAGGDAASTGGSMGGAFGTGGGAGAGGTFGFGGQGAGGFGELGGVGSGLSSGGAETSPDAGRGGAGGANGECPAGNFNGKLMGPYKSAAGSPDIGATVAFTVAAGGAVTGSFTGPNGAKAKLTGQLDCGGGLLTINVQNGTYPLGFTSVAFSGTMAGHYNAATGGFVDGTWELTERSTPGNGGTGTWTSTSP